MIYSFARRGHFIVGGHRSDGAYFNVISTDPSLPSMINAIKKLEEYRSCKCTEKEQCFKHKEQI
jgi:hypothetical protein